MRNFEIAVDGRLFLGYTCTSWRDSTPLSKEDADGEEQVDLPRSEDAPQRVRN
jgi:hypothetical protein